MNRWPLNLQYIFCESPAQTLSPTPRWFRPTTSTTNYSKLSIVTMTRINPQTKSRFPITEFTGCCQPRNRCFSFTNQLNSRFPGSSSVRRWRASLVRGSLFPSRLTNTQVAAFVGSLSLVHFSLFFSTRRFVPAGKVCSSPSPTLPPNFPTASEKTTTAAVLSSSCANYFLLLHSLFNKLGNYNGNSNHDAARGRKAYYAGCDLPATRTGGLGDFHHA